MSGRAAPRLSVIASFFDMRREAQRTLHSLTEGYQRGIDESDFEVLAVDNGSTCPLDEEQVRAFGTNFRHVYHSTRSNSPAAALNRAAETVDGDLVMFLVDGARILSPGILSYALAAARAFDDAFVHTLSMHLGPSVQNESMLEGYDQQVEDALLAGTTWRQNGYELFGVSSLAASSRSGFFSPLVESNCVALRRSTFFRLGGFDERFESPGGGLFNLDFFRRALGDAELEPVMLLGEATFHQFHGGVATNVPIPDHPWNLYLREYEAITKQRYETPSRSPHFLGHCPAECRHLFAPS